uniref:Uncharacterized protein n=1 Tax=Rhipicephalus zambeziensis TaxID=60191 RepID=A0A224YRG4_9ACAR
MLSLRLLVLLPLLVAPSGGARWAWGPKAELSQYLQNMSWHHDSHLSEELRKSVLDILERQPSPGLLHRRRVPFRPVADLQVFGSVATKESRQPRIRPEHRSGMPVGGSILAAKNSPPNMRFEKGAITSVHRRGHDSGSLLHNAARRGAAHVWLCGILYTLYTRQYNWF